MLLKNRLIWIHVPKTAGMFLNKAFIDCGFCVEFINRVPERERWNITSYNQKELFLFNTQHTVPTFNKSFKTQHISPSYHTYPENKFKRFFVIRNPYEWYKSYYSFKFETGKWDQCNLDQLMNPKFWTKNDLNWSIFRCFDTFRTYGYYSSFIKMLVQNKENIDFIKYENLNNELVSFFSKNGFNLEECSRLKHYLESKQKINKTLDKNKYQYVLNQNSREMIYHMDKYIFEAFGYEK